MNLFFKLHDGLTKCPQTKIVIKKKFLFWEWTEEQYGKHKFIPTYLHYNGLWWDLSLMCKNCHLEEGLFLDDKDLILVFKIIPEKGPYYSRESIEKFLQDKFK